MKWVETLVPRPRPKTPRTLRIPFVRRCTVISAPGERDGMVLDISVKGAYVKTTPLPETGESLTITFRVPGNDRLLRIRGVAAWLNRHQAHPVHSLPPGFGFRFLELTPEDMGLIAGTIDAYCQSNPLYRQYL
jgi:hypothetical protein